MGAPGRYLVLINPTGDGREYAFHQGLFPRYINAQLIFFSDGRRKEWKDESGAGKRIEAKVFVPPYGLVVLRQNQ